MSITRALSLPAKPSQTVDADPDLPSTRFLKLVREGKDSHRTTAAVYQSLENYLAKELSAPK